ncbi:expressed unknown protein [Seminavis robusta]|uniref:Uncharacterized protein n=1 Tax=Seminavis robusta TaxID=568900 RepID=A0A9N8ETU4_9STRA|nr:expressed unknown protein [Seminavis robusta]|eukprot:Sro2137_g316030.1 n/a (302) ;mRNA; r:6786-7691
MGASSSYAGEEEASYRVEQAQHFSSLDPVKIAPIRSYQDEDCCDTDITSTTYSMSCDSWSDPAIRWSQNRHDGVSPAMIPRRQDSVHNRTSAGPPRLPARARSTHFSDSGKRSTSSLPPRCLSDPLPFHRRGSVASAPERPTRMPSTHSPRIQDRAPPAMPRRSPTLHGVMEDRSEPESACPPFFDATCVAGPSSQKERTMVEIAPGVSIPLRTSEETLEAIRNDYFVPTTCVACTADLFCIEDARYSVCPCCRTVSQLEAAMADREGQHHGVGMGFTGSTLWQAQSDIMAQHQQTRRFSR